jgi:hypothetical protein
LGFLVVGHIHEDIDGSFGYLSKKFEKTKWIIMHVGKLDESFYDFIENVHPPTDTRNS